MKKTFIFFALQEVIEKHFYYITYRGGKKGGTITIPSKKIHRKEVADMQEVKTKKFYKASNNNMFKMLFCKRKNDHLLKELISFCLKYGINKNINNFVMLSPEHTKNIYNEKGKTLDVLIESDDEIINVEMNASYYKGLNERNAAYIFSKYAEDTKVAENYKKMKVFVQINLTVGKKDDEVCRVYQLKDQFNKDKYIENLFILEYNIDKALELWKNGDTRFSHIAFLEANEEELDKMAMEDSFMSEIRGEIVRLNKDQRFSVFLTEEEEERKYKNTIVDNAREEGRTEGEKQKALKIAKELLKDGMSVQKIADITKLKIKQIEALKTENA